MRSCHRLLLTCLVALLAVAQLDSSAFAATETSRSTGSAAGQRTVGQPAALTAAARQPARPAAAQTTGQPVAARTAAAAGAVPAYDHVLVVIMENHSADNIMANPAAPYINS